MSRKIEVFINPGARKGAIQRARTHFEGKTNASITEIDFPLKKINPGTEGIVVVGGDGTVNAVIEKVLQSEQTHVLFVTEGGTYNGQYHQLRKVGALIKSSQISEGNLPVMNLRPGLIDNQPFHFSAEIGLYGNPVFFQYCKSTREWLRSRNYRRLAWQITVFTGILKSLRTESVADLLPEIILNTPGLRKMLLVPEQHPSSDLLSRVTFNYNHPLEGKRVLTQVLLNLAVGRTPPRNLYTVQRASSFTSDHLRLKTTYMLDGEFATTPSGISIIKKSDRVIPMVALDLFSAAGEAR